MTAPLAAAPRSSALYDVADSLQASTVRLHAVAMARAHGLDALAIDRVGTIVTELAANLTAHAGGGQVLLRTVGALTTGCLEILALDRGPGIANMTRAMRNGPPSEETRRDGGFGEIKRLADLFDIYSQPNHGTAVVVHVGTVIEQPSTCPCSGSAHEAIGVVCVPARGEVECGDDWAVSASPGRLSAMIVDGLGHGPGAAIAALAASTAFGQTATGSPESVLGAMDVALHNTRGAALSVTVVDQVQRTARFCGVGNVDGRIVSPDSNRHLVPQNGIVGHTMPRAQAGDAPWPVGGRLVMHSDGISSRWRASDYPGILARHPALLAGVLFRDFVRSRDDATVLVLSDVPERAA